MGVLVSIVPSFHCVSPFNENTYEITSHQHFYNSQSQVYNLFITGTYGNSDQYFATILTVLVDPKSIGVCHVLVLVYFWFKGIDPFELDDFKEFL